MNTEPGKVLKIAVLGASGRLGRLLMAEIIRRPDLELVAGVVRHDSVMLGADLGELADTSATGIEASVSMRDAADAADIVIDVSAPSASMAFARQISERGGPPLVCGVTGLDSEQMAALKEASRTTPVLYARNFSLGAAVMGWLAGEAARLLPSEQFDIEIVETHHRRKADAPSGTALAIGEAAAAARGLDLDAHAIFERPRQGSARPVGAIGFSAVRGGGSIGEHSALYLGAFEELEIRHRANDRFIFARGALEAGKWLHGREPGLYGIQDVLGLTR
ncbi:MAG: 4-hydroxy-tetrahydrodipicolinate reductase [Caulobacterales bacterium]|uniref:4-hydroxy-tetrahydrodipicolinate reductase n=1 Tax=Glycocaulis sp. TaxID=1969725 RepID=UPI003FA06BB3